ncbi:H-NS family nucleoid-associated regulatory protein [Paracoccus sp. (in: a-proteobacteria)]|uniref:H-NS histone family protein n=1 Tax=Paracoccus sp. TaxID=267 RepID=UPI00396CDF83
MNIDIDTMSLKELRDLRTKLDRAINTYEDRKRREALAALESAAREHGFNLSELTGAKTRRGGSVSAKFANPDDPSKTWTGRGRKPRWVQEQLDQGKSMDDLAI